MQEFPEGFKAPSREPAMIEVDNYRYYFKIPVAGEVNEIVEKHTSPLQGTYDLLSKYCKITMQAESGKGTPEHAIWETKEVSLKIEDWATWHPKHVNTLIRWMNEHIFGLKGVEARLLEARSSSTNTRS